MLLLCVLISQCGAKQPAVTDAKFNSPVANHARFTDPCSSCHESKRLPVVKELNLTVAHGFGRDCAECHEYVDASPSWTAKAFSHVPKPTACVGCHILKSEMAKYDKPAAHGNGQLRGECAPCHQFGTGWDTSKNK